jgi:hypothetical protein
VNQELGLALFPHLAPVLLPHHVPWHLVEPVQVIEVQRVRQLRVPIRERPRPSEPDGELDRADQVHDVLLTATVILVSSAYDVQHHRARAEVERDVVTQSSSRSRLDRSAQAPLLDVPVPDVGVAKRSRDPLRIAPEAAFPQDAHEVVDVRDVEDRRVRWHPG